MSIIAIVLSVVAGFAMFGCIGSQFCLNELEEANGAEW